MPTSLFRACMAAELNWFYWYMQDFKKKKRHQSRMITMLHLSGYLQPKCKINTNKDLNAVPDNIIRCNRYQVAQHPRCTGLLKDAWKYAHISMNRSSNIFRNAKNKVGYELNTWCLDRTTTAVDAAIKTSQSGNLYNYIDGKKM